MFDENIEVPTWNNIISICLFLYTEPYSEHLEHVHTSSTCKKEQQF